MKDDNQNVKGCFARRGGRYKGAVGRNEIAFHVLVIYFMYDAGKRRGE